MVNHEAIAIEFQRQNIPFEAGKRINISYKGIQLIKTYIAGFVCYDSIIIEIKALSALTSDHEDQIIKFINACSRIHQ